MSPRIPRRQFVSSVACAAICTSLPSRTGRFFSQDSSAAGNPTPAWRDQGILNLAHSPYAKLKNIPVLAVHGDQDTTMSYDASKQMVELAKKAGVDATFLGVPGGSHTEAWTKVLPETFDFFERNKAKKK